MKKFRFADFAHHYDFRFHVQLARVDEASFDIHTHEFSELVIILNGTAVHVTEMEVYPVSAGDVFVLNGEMLHGFEEAKGLELCNIMYEPEQILSTKQDVRSIPGYQALFVLESVFRNQSVFHSKLQLNADELVYANNLIQRLLEEYENKVPGFETMICAHFMHLVVYLSRRYQHYTPNKHIWKLAHVMGFLAQNYTEKIRLRDLTELANMSTSHFERVFRETFHTSPIDYIVQLRIRKGCELMRHSHLSISQIAAEVGFSDSNYFSRQFKKIMNKTPTQYRKDLQLPTYLDTMTH